MKSVEKSRLAISVEGVYKNFRLPHEKATTIKSLFTGLLSGKHRRGTKTQHALRDISFSIEVGEFFGIVGRNGSGKSTLLKIIAGIYQPTEGKVTINGKLVPFIELGVGFNPELTGRENIYLSGALIGFTKSQIDEKYDDIVEFAELKDFMDQKLKNYSSGMQVRLAFSMAIRADADILLVDEVLAVGDADFQRKCFEYFRKLKKDKKTVVFVSHDMAAVREYCDRAILIEDSGLVLSGKALKVANAYTKMFIDQAKENKEESIDTGRWGDESLLYTSVKISKKSYTDIDGTVTITALAKANQTIEKPIFGFSISAPNGMLIMGTNTQIRKRVIPVIESGATMEITWEVPNVFADGLHYINVAAVYANGSKTSDWWDEAEQFTVYREEKTPYILSPEIALTVSRKQT